MRAQAHRVPGGARLGEQIMTGVTGFALIPRREGDKRLLLVGPGPVLIIDIAGASPAERADAVAYAQRLVEVLNASPLGREERRS